MIINGKYLLPATPTGLADGLGLGQPYPGTVPGIRPNDWFPRVSSRDFGLP